MSYPISLTFYTTAGLADLRAQIFSKVNVSVGSAISIGFIEPGAGMYIWFGDAPDDLEGGVKIYSAAAPADILAVRDIAPVEIEYVRTIRAGVVGRSVANNSANPTSIVYYEPDNTTVEFTHTLTDTERTVA